MPVVVAIAVRHRQSIIEEPDVKLPFLQYPTNGLVIIRGGRILAGFRMPPGAYQVRAVLSLQKPHHHHLPHQTSPPPAARPPPSVSLFPPYAGAIAPASGARCLHSGANTDRIFRC